MQLQTYRASALQKNEGLAPQIYAGGPPKITSNRLFYSIIVNTTMAGMAAAGSFSTLPAGNTLFRCLVTIWRSGGTLKSGVLINSNRQK